MHELSLAQSLVEQVNLAVQNENAVSVERITVAIGKYSGVECDAFEFAFPMAAADTLLEGAELVIEQVLISVKCQTCNATSHPPEPTLLTCQKCGSNEIKLIGGQEFLIRSVELEIPEDR